MKAGSFDVINDSAPFEYKILIDHYKKEVARLKAEKNL